MRVPFLRTVACATLVCLVSACHARTRVALPEGSAAAAGDAQRVALKANDSVRVTLRDGSRLEARVVAIEAEALTVRGRTDRGPAAARRLLWSEIAHVEREKFSVGRTALLFVGVYAGALVGWLVSPNQGR